MERAIHRLRVAGGHHEVGCALGHATKDALHALAAPPKGMTMEEARVAVQPYIASTQKYLLWVHEEIEGIAEGAGMDLFDVYIWVTEELSDPRPAERCTDIVVTPPISAEGHVLCAHNNDLGPATRDHLYAVEWEVDGQLPLFTLGVGPFISVGYNADGLALLGNQLTQTDVRPGVPRLLIVRDILSRHTTESALEAADNPHRASSYNQVIVHRDGTVIDFEGSATAHALLQPQGGWFVHTNHYCDPTMKRFECNPTVEGSHSRYRRAVELLETARRPVGLQALRAMLADHQATPTPICRHDGETVTVLWVLLDLTALEARYAPGQPCKKEVEERFSFA